MSTDEAWLFFKDTLHKGFELYTPKTKSKPNKKPYWLNTKCMKTIKKKYVMYKRYKSSKSHYDYQKYIESRNIAKREIKNSLKEYERKISKESKTNIKSFWKYVNNKLKRSTGISNLLKKDGTLTVDDNEKASVLNNFFSSVFTVEDKTNVPQLKPRNNNIFLPSILITQKAVKNKLSKLDPSKAMGPDKIPAIILKLCLMNLRIHSL